MSGNIAQFTPAVTATFQGNTLPMAITLPSVDPANPAVVLQNLGPGEAVVVAGVVPVTGAVANMPGAVRLAENQVVFLPMHPGFSTSTVASLQGGRLVFMRGAYGLVWQFPAPAVAVI